MNFIIAKMAENKFLKKMNINNLFDEYPVFDKKKEKLIKP
jgi:lantibiotic modifying enzyme